MRQRSLRFRGLIKPPTFYKAVGFSGRRRMAKVVSPLRHGRDSQGPLREFKLLLEEPPSLGRGFRRPQLAPDVEVWGNH